MLKSALVPRLSSSVAIICKMIMIHFCFSFSKYADISTYAGFQWKKGLFYKFLRVPFLIFANYFFLRRILKVLHDVTVLLYTCTVWVCSVLICEAGWSIFLARKPYCVNWGRKMPLYWTELTGTFFPIKILIIKYNVVNIHFLILAFKYVHRLFW